MKIYLLLVLVSTILVDTIHCLECYNCKNVTDVKQCKSLTTCADAQSCFVQKSDVGNGVTFEMGCLNNTKCGNRISLGNTFGKRQVSHCHECCSTNHCNSYLCGYSRVTGCEDDPTVDCARLESLFAVCQDSAKAHEVCPRFCGLCRNDSRTTVSPGVVTAKGSCNDMKSNCDMYDDAACRGIFEPWARANCAKTCNLCDRLETTTSGPPLISGSASGTTTSFPGAIVVISSSSYNVQGMKSPIKGTCFFNNQTFNLGDHWQDTCRYDCRCIDTGKNTAQCNDICPHYSSLPPSCTIRQKTGDCCPKLDCGNETDTTHQPRPVNATTVVNGSCHDKIPGCEYYEEVVCRGIYEPWARDHCALRCGYCGYSAPCIDTLTYCDAYELRTACRDYPGWARTNCKKSCGQCG